MSLSVTFRLLHSLCLYICTYSLEVTIVSCQFLQVTVTAFKTTDLTSLLPHPTDFTDTLPYLNLSCVAIQLLTQ